MKTALIIAGVIVLAGGFVIVRSWFEEGVSGESTFIGDSLVVAEYGYSHGGRKLLYAVIRSFPPGASDQQKSNDPRYRDGVSGTEVRDNDGRMIPAGRDGTLYFYDGDKLRTMKVEVGESDIGIGNCQSLDEIWARFQKFEIQTK